MPQDLSKDRIDRNLPEDPLSLQPWSMEGDADRLMDDLFEDIDRVLDGGTHLPKEPVKPEYVYLQPMEMSSLSLQPRETSQSLVLQKPDAKIVEIENQETQTPDAEMTAIEKVDAEAATITNQDTPQPEVAIAKTEDNSAIATKTEEPDEVPSHESSGNNLLWLIVGGFLIIPLGLLTAGVLWAENGGFSWQFLSWGQRFVSPATNSQLIVDPQEIATADARFANYMRRSLELIDRQIAARQEVATAPTPVETIPTSEPVANSQVPVPNRVPTVLERVYIPVYQPPSPLSPSLASPGLTPAVPGAETPIPPSSIATAPSPPALPMPPLQPSTHTLVGVLELGDRSAALFDIDGVTRRIKIGEAVGASGWMLADISNQEAIVRRNGEVRSIYVGQKF